jgi:hypothetical protein
LLYRIISGVYTIGIGIYCVPSIAGPLSWISYRICLLLSLLPLTTFRRCTRLSISEEIVQRPFYSRRLVYCFIFVNTLNVLLRTKQRVRVSVLQVLKYVSHCAGFQFDYVFDWTILKYQQSQMTSAPPRAIVSTSNSHPVAYLPVFNAAVLLYTWDFCLTIAHNHLFRLQR